MTIVTSCAALAAALKAAVAGAVITIAPGIYPACTVQDLTLPAGVIVQAAGVTFDSVFLSHITNLTWVGGATTAGEYFGWVLANDTNVVLQGATAANSPAAGFELEANRNLSIVGCVIRDRGADGIEIAGGSRISIEGCHDSGYNPNIGQGQHPDFIQGWATATVPLAHIWISGNTMVSTNAPVPGVPPSLGSMGIDFWNDNGPNGAPYNTLKDIHIVFNTLLTYGGTMVGFTNITDAASEIRGNVGTTGPGSPWPTQIDTVNSKIGELGPNTVNGVVQ